MASALQCRHKPSCLARCRFSCALLLPASWRSGRCCLRGGADGSVARFGRRWFAALAGSGASLGGTGGVVWRVGGSVERLFLSCSRRDTRCCSAQGSHLVCPSMAGSPQWRQNPRDFAFSSFSLKAVRCLSLLSSGVSGIRFGTGSFGVLNFLVLVLSALNPGFCFLLFRLA